jgi:hypothetical protein
MTDDLLEALGYAVKGSLCEVSACTANPVAERNGRALCARHRDHFDHATMGEPCDRCGSRSWVATPDATTAAVCAVCDYAEYDAEVIAHSW